MSFANFLKEDANVKFNKLDSLLTYDTKKTTYQIKYEDENQLADIIEYFEQKDFEISKVGKSKTKFVEIKNKKVSFTNDQIEDKEKILSADSVINMIKSLD